MRIKGLLLFAFGLLVSLATQTGARAQEFEDIEMEMFFAPAETVTSAARHDQPLSHSPSPVTILTREDIEASGARNLPEVLRLVPNMDVSMVKPIWYAVGVRGGTTEASDSLLLLVDGRDVTFELLGAPLWSTQHFSMDDIERIEVIRGPGSALYGANAFAGVVHVITRKPGQAPLADFSVRGGEHGQLELSGTSSFSLGPVGLLVSAGWLRQDLWTARDILAHEVVRGKLRGKIDLGSESVLTVETGAFMTEGRLHVDIGELEMQEMIDLYSMARFEFGDLLVQASHNRVYLDMDIGLTLYYPPLDINLADAPPVEGFTDKVSTLVQYSFEIFHNRLTVGAEYVFNYYHVDVLVDPDHQEHRVGAFIQDELSVSSLVNEVAGTSMPPLIVTAGLRYDHNSKTRYELSPRAAVVFAPAENHSFRFGYAHAFLKPTFFESSLHIDLEPRDVDIDELDVANPDLDNQTIDSLELGYGGSFFENLIELHLDFAYNWYRDSISFSYDPENMDYIEIGGYRIPNINGGGFGFSNKAGGKNGHDVDLQIIARPVDDLRIFFTAGYRQIFKSFNNEFSRSDPFLRLATGLDWRLDAGLAFSLRAYYTARHWRTIGDPKSILNPMLRVELPAYVLLNARVEYELGGGPFELKLGVEGFNLLGARFRELSGFNNYELGRYDPKEPDHGGERLDRKVIFFLRGTI